MKPGVISIASHSGAMFGGVARTLDRLGVGISKFVAVGNEADLDMMDFIEYFIADPSTRVIGLIIEAIADGRRLRDLARRAAQAGKAIVAVKVGRSAAGIGAALAHSSRMSGGARAYDALFHAAGIASVGSVEALAGGCAVLAMRTPETLAADRKLVCITSSGAGGALLADGAAERHMTLAGSDNGEWGDALAEPLRSFGVSGRVRNPIDLGVVSNDWEAAITGIYQVLEKAGATGPTAVYTHIPATQGQDQQILNALVQRRQRTAAPIVVVVPGGLSPAAEAAYAQAQIPLFHDTATCLDSLACHYATLSPGARVPRFDSRAPDHPAWLDLLRTKPVLSEVESAGILREAGVPVVESRTAGSLAEAQQHAQSFGCPVVLKVLVPNIVHKAAAGFVAIGLDVASLPPAYEEMERKVAAAGHARSAVQFIVQPMLKSRAELILGVSREGGLGHFLIVGLGGVHAELFDQVLLFPVPSARSVLQAEIASSWIGRYLRMLSSGAEDALVAQILDALDALAGLVATHESEIESIDVNPLLVTDRGCIAVDALIVASGGTHG